MKLFGMVASFDSQLSSNEYHELSFEERVGLLVDSEWTDRERRKLSRRLKVAKLRYPASLENVNFQAPRGLNRQQILTLGSGRWIAERHNLLITGPTGIGKSFLACAFVERACRRGFASYYVRASRLVHDLAVARGDGSYTRVWAGSPSLTFLPSTIGSCTRSTMPRDVTSWKSSRSARARLDTHRDAASVKQWHTAIGDPNHADALCDRILHRGHRITLKGASLRKTKTVPKTETSHA